MVIGIDANLLMGYYQAKAGLGQAVAGAGGAAAAKAAPTPPWSKPPTEKQLSAAVTSALAGRKLFDEGAAQLDVTGASADYRKLFALYQGIGTLSELANDIKDKNVNAGDKSRLQQVFTRGMAELEAFVKTADFEKLRLSFGEVDTSQKAALSVAKEPTKYTTVPLGTSATEALSAFEGDVRFTIRVKRVNETIDVPIDLSAMPDQTRSLANVINYVNDELKNAGVETRFGTHRIPGEPKQVKAGSQTITLPAGPDQWAMKVTIGTSETVTFAAADTAGAVYLAQQVGKENPDNDTKTADSTIRQQLLKFQTDTTTVPAPAQGQEGSWVDGRVFAKDLEKTVKTVHAQTVGPDGAVYMLADVTGTVDEQKIKGTQDVALLKYDSAGNLIYSRTLGAAGSASGLGLAVSADGKIAIAGSVSGALEGAVDGALNSGTTGAWAGLTDSFVTLFDKDGQEIWTERRGAHQDDQVNSVAFGADGKIYVAGQAKSAIPGAGAPLGDWDGYIEAFATDSKGKASTVFSQSFGTAGGDKPKGMVIDGNALVVASVEAGHAVLRRFDVSGAAPVEIASRDLGDLEGGDIQGLALDANGQVVLVGTTANPVLSVSAVTRGASGGMDAFAARISADLSVNGSERLAYYGGAGDDRATAMALSNGQVWIAGSAGTDLPDQDPVGDKDGFLARLNVDTGAIEWSRRFTGVSRQAAPSAIAVAPQGASVLDRLGLPTGQLSLDGSQQISAVSAVRPGDQFTLSVNGGAAKTVTIEAADTLDSLALKIKRASGFAAKVTVGLSAEGLRNLRIEPASSTAVVQIGAGKGDKDALQQLGIAEGVVRATKSDDDKTVSADGGPEFYGLGLHTGINLSNADQISHALAELSSAQDAIRNAYKDMVAAAQPKSAQNAAAAATGKVPAYMSNQIANYQAALNRLLPATETTDSTGLAGLFG